MFLSSVSLFVSDQAAACGVTDVTCASGAICTENATNSEITEDLHVLDAAWIKVNPKPHKEVRWDLQGASQKII